MAAADCRRYAAASVSLLVCDTTATVTVEEEAVAEAVATAAAIAIAEVSAACFSSGLSTFTVNGRSIAMATATAWAEAFATATATSAACSKCETVATFIGETFSDILLEAVADAEVNLEKLHPGADAIQVANSLVADIQEATIVAFATVRLFEQPRPRHCQQPLYTHCTDMFPVMDLGTARIFTPRHSQLVC